MCGIVGYIGKRRVKKILLDGLSQLEYRGYDSAGIAFFDSTNKALAIKKNVGRVEHLRSLVADKMKDRNGYVGIAHTRWATHGEVTNENAHPHVSFGGKVVVVHNGVIDNYLKLKAELEASGVRFRSETDTEVIAHLIEQNYNGDPIEATTSVLERINGTYGLAILFLDQPDALIVARNGSPIVIGIGEDEAIVASDPQAIINYTRSVVYLKDREIAYLKKDNLDILKLNGEQSKLSIETLENEFQAISKENYKHFMLKEIYEQPESVERCLAGRLRPEHGGAVLGGMNLSHRDLASLKCIHSIGCGTAYYAGMITSNAIESFARMPAITSLAVDLRSRNIVVPQDYLYLAYSQSGETADTIGAVKEILLKGGETAGIINTVGSTLSRLCGKGVYLHAGPEVAVASTKAFTGQITAGLLFALMLGRTRILSESEGGKIAQELKGIPDKMREYLSDIGPVEEAANIMTSSKYVLFMGRGYSYPIALEAALKFKELAYTPCEGYHAGEMKHGPIAMIENGTPVVSILLNDSQREKTITNIKEAQARGAILIIIHSKHDEEAMEIADLSIQVPHSMDYSSPLITALPIQLLAYYGALSVGADVDKPRNLAKSVTVE